MVRVYQPVIKLADNIQDGFIIRKLLWVKNNIKVAVEKAFPNKVVIGFMEQWNVEEIQTVHKTIENDTSLPVFDIDITIYAQVYDAI